MAISITILIYFLAFVGLLTLLSKISLKLKPFKFNPKKAKFALITGSSDGIGKEFCLDLARRGHDIILMARSVKNLEIVSNECRQFGVETMVIPFDFGKATAKQWEALQKQLDDKEIGVLINNVGVSHDFPVSFLDESPERCEMITAVNIDALMKITRIVLPQMVKRKYGLVLNIGSMLGKVPSSLLSVYSGSKAFVRHWSQCIIIVF
jgi:17beta-estradiol 17-dehydrogenase / very-long-chain 3-oxoacyl-CoA reductase